MRDGLEGIFDLVETTFRREYGCLGSVSDAEGRAASSTELLKPVVGRAELTRESYLRDMAEGREVYAVGECVEGLGWFAAEILLARRRMEVCVGRAEMTVMNSVWFGNSKSKLQARARTRTLPKMTVCKVAVKHAWI